MRKKTIEVTGCSDCSFVFNDDELNEFCGFDNEYLEKRAVPLQIGKYERVHKANCYLKTHEVTFKLKYSPKQK